MKSTVSVLFSYLVLAVSQDSAPELDKLLYGGILSWPVPATTEHEDVIKAVETAVLFVEGRTCLALRGSDGDLLPYSVSKIEKMKLVFTHDDRRPLLQTNVHPGTSTLLVFGFTYIFRVSWTFEDSTISHNFITTMYPEGVFHIFSHTSPFTFIETTPPVNSSTSDRTSSRCTPLMLSHSGFESDWVGSRSCTDPQAILGDDHNGDVHKNLYKPGAGSDARPSETVSDRGFTISLMTFNVWNYNSRPEQGSFHYMDRIKRLGMVINLYKPDIIAFQEVRFENGKGGFLGPNQVLHLADMLKGYQFVYEPAQLHPTSHKNGRTEEGLAIFSRYPIVSHDHLKLFRNESNSADMHQRLCQHVEIRLPHSETVHIFNTHLSLSHEAREQSVIQMWHHMQKFDGAAILMGDFNAEPYENAMKYLNRKTSLIDVWTHLHGNKPVGYTFNTLDSEISKRIDYIFVRRKKNLRVLNTSVIDNGKRGDKAASDHLPLVSTLEFNGNKIVQ